MDPAADAAALRAALGALAVRWRALPWPAGAACDERGAAGARCLARVAAALAERAPEVVAAADEVGGGPGP